MYCLLPSNFVIFKVGLPNAPMGNVTRLHASFLFESSKLEVLLFLGFTRVQPCVAPMDELLYWTPQK